MLWVVVSCMFLGHGPMLKKPAECLQLHIALVVVFMALDKPTNWRCVDQHVEFGDIAISGKC